jgi:hypothetical protein
MATKREVMLAGVAAKLAHMIASDQVQPPPNAIAPTGSTQADATLLERNLSLVAGVAGDTAVIRGVRLRPATGQYLHAVRNLGPNMINVWPDTTEWFNGRNPGDSWAISPGSTGFFIPSRRTWLAGNLLGGADRASTINGPVQIGNVVPPADATNGALFVADVLCIALGLRGTQLPPPSGRLTFNAYYDAAGIWRYQNNGPAMQFRFDGGSGQLAIHTAVSGLTDQPIPPWDPIPSNPIATFGPNAMGLGTAPPIDAAASSLFANYICVPWSTGIGGGLAARINFNCYFDTTLALRYAATGPAYRIVFPSSGLTGMHLRSAPAGTPDAVLPTLTDLFAALGADQITTGQTNIMLTTNEAGTVTYQQVLVGPANSGPGGTGRALYVAT